MRKLKVKVNENALKKVVKTTNLISNLSFLILLVTKIAGISTLSWLITLMAVPTICAGIVFTAALFIFNIYDDETVDEIMRILKTTK